jgi:hypothetical protein
MKKLLTLALCLGFAGNAYATRFTVNITNNSTRPWTTGLLTTSQLISLGPVPASTSPQYHVYRYAHLNCNLSDSFCTAPGCTDTGNALVLAQRLGLVIGVNAWVVPSLAAGGGTTTVNFQATYDMATPPKMSFLAQVSGSGDDLVMMHVTGSNSTLAVPLFTGAGAPIQNLSYSISGYDISSVSATDGSAAGTCAVVCTVPPQPESTNCWVAAGNGTTTLGPFAQPATTPAVAQFTAVSGNAQNQLWWNNVAPHRGTVVVRRANVAVAWTPTNGTPYPLNTQVQNLGGNPTVVVHSDLDATATDTATSGGLTNGTRYFYKAFAFNGNYVYANGNIPTSNGIFSIPTLKAGTQPKWCYSVGTSTTQQPVTELGAAVFSAGNGGAVTANRTTVTNPATDGFERFRPVPLTAAVQARFPVVGLRGQSAADTFIITGDQGGRVYAINARTGDWLWTANNGNPFTTGDIIQAQPAVQLYAYSNSTFQNWSQAALPTGFGVPTGTDLVFVATRISAVTNRIYALRATDGARMWTYNPGNLGMVNGGMLVDYTNNRLYVGTRAGPGTGGAQTIRILDTLTGASVPLTPAQITALSVGDIDHGINKDFTSNQAYIINSTGTAHGIDMTTFASAWNIPLGVTPNAYIWPLGNGFLASVGTAVAAGGSVRRYKVAGAVATLQWSAGILGPTGITVDYADGGVNAQKVLVGNLDGGVRQLFMSDGGVEKVLSVTTVPVGAPTIDKTTGRMHVGTFDGRVCAYPVPLP